MMWGTRVMSKSMYPDTIFDVEQGWPTVKLTDVDDFMLVVEVFVYELIKTKIPPIS